jgi:sigma-B regulation protein RsbU (phosphoserine phosphatase)
MCRRIQEELLPRGPLPLRFGEVKGVSIPAREVGGDFFNYFVLPEGEVAVLVGDVSGKGVAAALLMANLQATLHARLPLETNLGRLAEQLDVEIEASTPTSSYLTLFMAVLDAQGRRLSYVNAGHQTQFVLRARGGVEPLESVGRPLGLLPGGGYEQRELELGEGDALFLFTDGLSESEDATGEPFGDHLPELLGELKGRPTDEILAVVESAVLEHRQGAEAADDATMVVLALRAEDSASMT